MKRLILVFLVVIVLVVGSCALTDPFTDDDLFVDESQIGKSCTYVDIEGEIYERVNIYDKCFVVEEIEEMSDKGVTCYAFYALGYTNSLSVTCASSWRR